MASNNNAQGLVKLVIVLAVVVGAFVLTSSSSRGGLRDEREKSAGTV